MSTDIKKTHLTADPTLSSIPKAETTPSAVKSEKTPTDSFQKNTTAPKLKTYTTPLMAGAYNVLGNVDGPAFPRNLTDPYSRTTHKPYLNLLGAILGLGELEDCFEKIKKELEDEVQKDKEEGSEQNQEDTEEEGKEQKK